MSELEIIQQLAQLFMEEDMSQMDASDFVDKAGQTFDLVLEARQWLLHGKLGE